MSLTIIFQRLNYILNFTYSFRNVMDVNNVDSARYFVYLPNNCGIFNISFHFLLATWTEFISEGCSTSCGEGEEKFTRICEGAGECLGEPILMIPCKDLPVCGKF